MLNVFNVISVKQFRSLRLKLRVEKPEVNEYDIIDDNYPNAGNYKLVQRYAETFKMFTVTMNAGNAADDRQAKRIFWLLYTCELLKKVLKDKVIIYEKDIDEIGDFLSSNLEKSKVNINPLNGRLMYAPRCIRSIESRLTDGNRYESEFIIRYGFYYNVLKYSMLVFGSGFVIFFLSMTSLN